MISEKTPTELDALAVRFPHNMGGQRAHDLLEADLRSSASVLLVEPSGDRARLVHMLARRAAVADGASVRLLLGRPLELFKRWRSFRRGEVEDEFFKLWVENGVSFAEAPEILQAQAFADSGRLEARIANQGCPLGSAAQATDGAVTFGGTVAGLTEEREALVALARFSAESEPERHRQGALVLEALWCRAAPFDLGRVLKRLVDVVPWERALARALALILEGAWARDYVAPHELLRLERPLLRHQLAGLGQALWILDHVGSVLVADPTGSGKTRLGAWILRAVYDRCARAAGTLPQSPVMVAPPGTRSSWEAALADDAQLPWQVDSHGKLHAPEPGDVLSPLQRRIRAADVLAVDEAHNFHNRRSGRTRALLEHFADHVILFTATPINRTPADLHALVELLGPDHLSDEALRVVRRLRHPYGGLTEEERLRSLQEAIASFTVRRSRQEVDTQLRAEPDRGMRYPDRDVRLFKVDCPARDLIALEQIKALSVKLTGVLNVGLVVEMPPGLDLFRQTEESYLRSLPARCAALARYGILAAVRSSRAAAWEHIYGTERARSELEIRSKETGKAKPTGDIVTRLRGAAGSALPRWNLSDEARKHAPPWLIDVDAHREAAHADVALYQRIAELVLDLSDDGLRSRVDLLERLFRDGHKILAFERRLITLDALHQHLDARGVPPTVFTGGLGKARALANRLFGLESEPTAQIGLFSDSFAEGFNLQGADVVVHLDFPTVLRLGEQRSGRIDRMDSRHPRVQIWLPRDPEPLQPEEEEALIRRDREAATVMGGSNNAFPAELYSVPIDPEAMRSRIERREGDLLGFDAFRPLRDLIGLGGLVSREVYDQERMEEAPLTAAVSAVHGATRWALLALRGEGGEAPRWVFKDSPSATPIVDFRQISERLRGVLPLSAQDRSGVEPMAKLLASHLRSLEGQQHALLPHGRRRAIDLVVRHLKTVEGDFLQRPIGVREQATACLDVLTGLRRGGDGRVPDLRAVGTICLSALRPLRDIWRADPTRRRRFFRIEDLGELLMLPRHELDVGELFRQLEQVPHLKPLGQRLFVAIVAVPAHLEPETGPLPEEAPHGSGSAA